MKPVRVNNKLTLLVGAAWCTFGLLLPVVLLANSLVHGMPDNLWLWLAILVATAMGTNFDLEFSFGNSKVYLAVSTLPIILGVVALQPWQAAITCVVAEFAAIEPWRRTRPIVRVFTAATWSVNAIVASTMAGFFTGEGTPSHYAMPAAFLAAISFVCMDIVVEAVRTRFSGGEIRELLRAMVPVGATDVGISTIGVALVIPFVPFPPLLFLMLTVELALAVALSRLATSESRLRGKSDHLQDVFSRYVPEALVGQHLDHFESVELGGEQAHITVLFCDIRGFTSWSENREAAEIITELNVLLTELSSAVMGAHGTLDKFTGDGLMAFWGAPLKQDDHADLACRAALDMLRRLDQVNERRCADGDEPFAIGIGIHSGTAVVGNIGHEKRLDYTAIGDTVNLAARLEAATKEIGSVLLLSESCVMQIGSDLRERAMRIGSITVKGRRKPVEAWALPPDSFVIEDLTLDDPLAA